MQRLLADVNLPTSAFGNVKTDKNRKNPYSTKSLLLLFNRFLRYFLPRISQLTGDCLDLFGVLIQSQSVCFARTGHLIIERQTRGA